MVITPTPGMPLRGVIAGPVCGCDCTLRTGGACCAAACGCCCGCCCLHVRVPCGVAALALSGCVLKAAAGFPVGCTRGVTGGVVDRTPTGAGRRPEPTGEGPAAVPSLGVWTECPVTPAPFVMLGPDAPGVLAAEVLALGSRRGTPTPGLANLGVAILAAPGTVPLAETRPPTGLCAAPGERTPDVGDQAGTGEVLVEGVVQCCSRIACAASWLLRGVLILAALCSALLPAEGSM